MKEYSATNAQAKSRDHHGDPTFLVLLQHLLEDGQEGTQDGSVGDGSTVRGGRRSPTGPLNFHPGGLFRVDITRHSADIAGPAACIVDARMTARLTPPIGRTTMFRRAAWVGVARDSATCSATAL